MLLTNQIEFCAPRVQNPVRFRREAVGELAHQRHASERRNYGFDSLFVL